MIFGVQKSGSKRATKQGDFFHREQNVSNTAIISYIEHDNAVTPPDIRPGGIVVIFFNRYATLLASGVSDSTGASCRAASARDRLLVAPV